MSMDLRVSGFTRDHYRNLVRLAKAKYVFRRFDDFAADERFILWRHDLDMSVHAAASLARIDAEEGVACTYFLFIHSEFYNLFEAAVSERVRQVIGFGHAIGLHFDTSYYGLDREDALEQPLLREKAMIEAVFGVSIAAFSFHNTNEFTDRCRAHTYAGMVNAYSGYFRSNVGYVSDSNGYWRHRNLEEVLIAAQDERLQVLTHPVWWQDAPMTPRERVERCIQGRAKATAATYDSTLAAAGRENIGG